MKKIVPKGEIHRINSIDYVAGTSYDVPDEKKQEKPKKKRGED